MMYRGLALLTAFSLFFLFSCEDDEGSEPEIELKNVSPLQVTEYVDSLVFTVAYKDADGDLGENNPDVKNLFLTDSRNALTYAYRVQQLAPSGSSVGIEGTLNVIFRNAVILGDSSVQEETARYTIYVVDRAGHRSNSIRSPGIIISR